MYNFAGAFMKRFLSLYLTGLLFLYGCANEAQDTAAGVTGAGEGTPDYVVDPFWPQSMPNLWKIGGITGLAVDADDNVWIYNRPNDITALELHAEVGDAECCVRPPSMIHLNPQGEVIGWFDAPQGHGMEVDSQGFVYLGQDTVRKYDPRTGEVVGEIERTPEREGGGRVGLPAWPPERLPGIGSRGPIANFINNLERARNPETPAPDAEAQARAEQERMAFRAKYPPETPMIVGGLEEIRVMEDLNEIYVADNYLGGRVLVFDFETLAFKRGWGAYGKPLSEISVDDADHAYTPGGPMAPDFVGHLTLNVSNDGLVYAADRNGNRIHVTELDGTFIDEFILAPTTGIGGSTGGVAFSPDPEQRYLYISDLTNNKIWFLDRASGEVVGELGQLGENAGEFYGLHMIDVDSQGNIYTGEVFSGERAQRFVPVASERGQMLNALRY
jgi:hypothetical protein